jgi:hypothetical protein
MTDDPCRDTSDNSSLAFERLRAADPSSSLEWDNPSRVRELVLASEAHPSTPARWQTGWAGWWAGWRTGRWAPAAAAVATVSVVVVVAGLGTTSPFDVGSGTDADRSTVAEQSPFEAPARLAESADSSYSSGATFDSAPAPADVAASVVDLSGSALVEEHLFVDDEAVEALAAALGLDAPVTAGDAARSVDDPTTGILVVEHSGIWRFDGSAAAVCDDASCAVSAPDLVMARTVLRAGGAPDTFPGVAAGEGWTTVEIREPSAPGGLGRVWSVRVDDHGRIVEASGSFAEVRPVEAPVLLDIDAVLASNEPWRFVGPAPTEPVVVVESSVELVALTLPDGRKALLPGYVVVAATGESFRFVAAADVP